MTKAGTDETNTTPVCEGGGGAPAHRQPRTSFMSTRSTRPSPASSLPSKESKRGNKIATSMQAP
jgi:hypothetical protein